ncbi:hypothetical protein ASE60_32060 [Ensifer sp. Root278]|nr:hypothetical protein ASE60_32060 [Ensifer sp. Root278]
MRELVIERGRAFLKPDGDRTDEISAREIGLVAGGSTTGVSILAFTSSGHWRCPSRPDFLAVRTSNVPSMEKLLVALLRWASAMSSTIEYRQSPAIVHWALTTTTMVSCLIRSSRVQSSGSP